MGYFFFMNEKIEKKELAILRLLQKAGTPVSSLRLKENLHAMGHEVSERTIRHYFLDMDRRGLTKNQGKKGRAITELGLKELSSARVYDKVGLLAAKIDQLTYRMNFDLYKKSGTVIINVSLANKEQFPQIVPLVCRVYDAGYSMGTMMAIFEPGERVGGIIIPEGMVGLGTVCSITLNGVLLAHGIPTHSSFGGLLEVRGNRPARFVEIIKYEGTSLDPLEIFIKGGMTSALQTVETGNG